MLGLVVGIAAVLAALLAGALAMLFWQMKRASSTADILLTAAKESAVRQIESAALKVSAADMERAMNIVIAERDRLEFAVDTAEEQRDELLKEAFEHATPGMVATTLRDALERVRDFPTIVLSDDMPDLPTP